MMNFTLTRGEWRRGTDRVSPNTVRAIHARGACRLWIPITPETADALGWGPKATAREWPRFQFGGKELPTGRFNPYWDARGLFGPCIHVPVDAWGGPDDDGVVFRLYPRLPRPAHYEAIGATPRKGAPSGWCWEVRPRVGAPAILEERGGVEVARHEIRGDICKDPACCPEAVVAQAIHERIGKDLAAIDPAAWRETPRG